MQFCCLVFRRMIEALRLLDRINFGDDVTLGGHFSSSKPADLTALSSATSVASRLSIRSSGQLFGPSENAFSGQGWVSMNKPEIPTATAARVRTGTNSRCPPEDVPCPPSNWTECVASNTTGQAVSRMMASERMSDTRLL